MKTYFKRIWVRRSRHKAYVQELDEYDNRLGKCYDKHHFNRKVIRDRIRKTYRCYYSTPNDYQQFLNQCHKDDRAEDERYKVEYSCIAETHRVEKDKLFKIWGHRYG